MTDLRQSLYVEHLKEISALYEKKLWLMKSYGLPWFDFMDIDARMEPHIDALVVGGALAMMVCSTKTVEGDFGEVYGAVRVLARISKYDILTDVICRMDLQDDLCLKAVIDGLCHESTLVFNEEFILTLMACDANRIRLAAQIIAFHRLDYARELVEALDENPGDKDLILDILYAMGRLRSRYGAERILGYLHSGDEEISDAAITALVRIGERHALDECMSFIGPSDWPRMSLGLYGDKDSLNDTFFSVSFLSPDIEPDIPPAHVIAAGLLGNTARVPDLISWLKKPQLEENAAYALYLITGMEFLEEPFIADMIAANKNYHDETEAWRRGTLHPHDYPAGKTQARLSRNPDLWKGWWEYNWDTFKPDLRYRFGRPYSPQCLVDTLKSELLPDHIRKLAYEELVIRYGIDVPFDTCMTAVQQYQAIEMYMIRLKGNPDHFIEGAWYYRGKPMDADTSEYLAMETEPV